MALGGKKSKEGSSWAQGLTSAAKDREMPKRAWRGPSWPNHGAARHNHHMKIAPGGNSQEWPCNPMKSEVRRQTQMHEGELAESLVGMKKIGVASGYWSLATLGDAMMRLMEAEGLENTEIGVARRH